MARVSDRNQKVKDNAAIIKASTAVAGTAVSFIPVPGVAQALGAAIAGTGQVIGAAMNKGLNDWAGVSLKTSFDAGNASQLDTFLHPDDRQHTYGGTNNISGMIGPAKSKTEKIMQGIEIGAAIGGLAGSIGSGVSGAVQGGMAAGDAIKAANTLHKGGSAIEGISVASRVAGGVEKTSKFANVANQAFGVAKNVAPDIIKATNKTIEEINTIKKRNATDVRREALAAGSNMFSQFFEPVKNML
jgi:hypothetical protein